MRGLRLFDARRLLDSCRGESTIRSISENGQLLGSAPLALTVQCER
jgi:hypothetical protein